MGRLIILITLLLLPMTAVGEDVVKPDAADRAEARRRAITARTLATMDGLDRPITASMGLLDFAAVADDPDLDFWSLYTRADQLLYDAKCAGRNRTGRDALEWFVPQADGAASAVA